MGGHDEREAEGLCVPRMGRKINTAHVKSVGVGFAQRRAFDEEG